MLTTGEKSSALLVSVPLYLMLADEEISSPQAGV
jgi:hypothetical protein